MRNLEKIKKQFISILSVLGILSLLLLGYLLWPGTSTSAKFAQEESLKEQEKTLTREVSPLRNIEHTLAQTRVDVKKFYEQKVPSEFSQISQHLEKLTQETGVTAQSIRYTQDRRDEKTDLPELERVKIETSVTGDYAKVARFINALEQDKFIFIIDQITLNGSEGGNLVSLQIKFETFLKQG
jgi:Tfp pilus assembly protein PilO